MKILKWIMRAVVALVTIITLIVLFADDLEHTYNKLTWTPPMEINAISLGITNRYTLAPKAPMLYLSIL